MRYYYRSRTSVYFKLIIILFPILFLLNYCGVFDYLMEKNFSKSFDYPLNENVIIYANQVRHGLTPDVDPINIYDYSYFASPKFMCKDPSLNFELILIVKSAPSHFEKRNAIRNSWGYERQFSNIEIRTIFNLGVNFKDSGLQFLVMSEISKYRDIIQSNFEDSYFNNTIKTMMGIRWLVENCPQAKFFMFVDDDYFISVKNVLRFISDPFTYPKSETNDEIMEKFVENGNNQKQDLKSVSTVTDLRLFAGLVIKSRPLRQKFSKWHISLKEYQWDKWPPYITAGAFIMSRETLFQMYFLSMFTKHFRFDDIFLAIMAYKLRIHLHHSDEFHFYKKTYNGPKSYENVIASHGYNNSEEMIAIWNELKMSRYA